MRRIAATTIFQTALLLVVSCQSNTDCSELADCIGKLHQRTMSGPSWEESDTGLLNDRLFLRLYASADDRFADLIGLIRSESGEDIKLLAVIIAQGLSRDRYVEFSKAVLEARIRGDVSDKIVAYCIYPGTSWGTGLVDLVHRADVQAILASASKIARSEILTERISAIRDGSYSRYLDHLKERGVVVPTVAAKLEELQSQ